MKHENYSSYEKPSLVIRNSFSYQGEEIIASKMLKNNTKVKQIEEIEYWEYNKFQLNHILQIHVYKNATLGGFYLEIVKSSSNFAHISTKSITFQNQILEDPFDSLLLDSIVTNFPKASTGDCR